VTASPIDFSAFGALPADTNTPRDEVLCDLPTAPKDPYLTYLTGVLDSIVIEAIATKGGVKTGIAVAILILDRVERFVLRRDEGVRLFELAPDTGHVCGTALLTKDCPLQHHWVDVVTTAGERFELPFGEGDGHS
jgi:hypothetical protein